MGAFVIVDSSEMRDLAQLWRTVGAATFDNAANAVDTETNKTGLNADDSSLNRNDVWQTKNDVVNDLKYQADQCRNEAQQFDALAQYAEGDALGGLLFGLGIGGLAAGIGWAVFSGNGAGHLDPDVIRNTVDAATKTAKSIVDSAIGVAQKAYTVGKSLVDDSIGLLRRGHDELLNGAKWLWDKVTSFVKEAWNKIWGALTALFRDVVEGIKGLVSTVADVLKAGVNAGAQVGKWVTDHWRGIVDFLHGDNLPHWLELVRIGLSMIPLVGTFLEWITLLADFVDSVPLMVDMVNALFSGDQQRMQNAMDKMWDQEKRIFFTTCRYVLSAVGDLATIFSGGLGWPAKLALLGGTKISTISKIIKLAKLWGWLGKGKDIYTLVKWLLEPTQVLAPAVPTVTPPTAAPTPPTAAPTPPPAQPRPVTPPQPPPSAPTPPAPTPHPFQPPAGPPPTQPAPVLPGPIPVAPIPVQPVVPPREPIHLLPPERPILEPPRHPRLRPPRHEPIFRPRHHLFEGQRPYENGDPLLLARREAAAHRVFPVGYGAPGDSFVSVRRWVESAGGHLGYGHHPFEVLDQAGVAIDLDAHDMRAGDILQVADPHRVWGAHQPSEMHSAMVLATHPDGTVDIVESNWIDQPGEQPGTVGIRTHVRLADLRAGMHDGLELRCYRLGRVEATV